MARGEIAVLAYSGGLDTSFCIPYLRERHGYDVISVTVDTGGFAPDELAGIEERARALGVREHRTIDARADVYDRYVGTLIRGNVLRGGVYPLCVAAERVVQALKVAEVVREVGAQAVAHGSTAAGNDQVRFDIAFAVLLPGVKALSPIRDEGLSREEEYRFLRERGVAIDRKVEAYSINTGLWGTTIGGGETHDGWATIPEDVWPSSSEPVPSDPRRVVIGFRRGLPVSLDGRALAAVDLVSELGAIARTHRVGRGIHIGDTVLGIKGRIAFEAGAAVVLIHAHRELEKVVLTYWQRHWKDAVADFYGKMLHEGLAFDPVLGDIEALIERSQARVDGEARIRLGDGSFLVEGIRSPHGLLGAKAAVYGEKATLWTGEDVKGFSRIAALSEVLWTAAGDGGGRS
ncbi:MAG: argininosuccinate synthase [Planctomycetes bacterium]|nr:argininosuccinate synthase [Planctomycetota bacterium]